MNACAASLHVQACMLSSLTVCWQSKEEATCSLSVSFQRSCNGFRFCHLCGVIHLCTTVRVVLTQQTRCLDRGSVLRQRVSTFGFQSFALHTQPDVLATYSHLAVNNFFTGWDGLLHNRLRGPSRNPGQSRNHFGEAVDVSNVPSLRLTSVDNSTAGKGSGIQLALRHAHRSLKCICSLDSGHPTNCSGTNRHSKWIVLSIPRKSCYIFGVAHTRFRSEWTCCAELVSHVYTERQHAPDTTTLCAAS